MTLDIFHCHRIGGDIISITLFCFSAQTFFSNCRIATSLRRLDNTPLPLLLLMMAHWRVSEAITKEQELGQIPKSTLLHDCSS
ncbi:hypothetical protein M404DRAFT_801818 [Pisolithus tinctorius Marx 270]|uniref:Uncharacterized protein n=1 Tax=Pisolithus tinctorius Marx 270 TaxID=870435 RepID=A0A0C3KQT8_PISTI|nr:hypothetical protein M404DRAFT_801818 [Pisolithus tinctorius Marx 270]